ncbi:unnamed protein product [Acanthoscelides obtectus]|uniref:Uncharacterized protein n=1 Tax=Acanthoscelides obtectus TaxID=200917 RepID=A0A9P0JRW0_ACAOB|nr:unnamed protein product [Acanthoscelides obtectus]CAK1662123.1 hypothetical protein AOBTE_LOCUS22999 [Acanthoscelides obtectus]
MLLDTVSFFKCCDRRAQHLKTSSCSAQVVPLVF